MSIHFRCLACSRPLVVEDHLGGQTIPCPDCRTKMNVPSAATAPAIAPTGRSPASTVLRLALVGGVIAFPLVCFVVALPLLLVPRRQPADTPRTPEPIAAAQPAVEPKPRGETPRRVVVIPDEPPAPPAQADLAGPPPKPPEPIPAEFKYSVLATVLEANRGQLPPTGDDLTEALARVGSPAQLPVSFSAVALDSGLANPRVVFAPDNRERARSRRTAAAPPRRREAWSPAIAEGPSRRSTISETDPDTPDFAGRLFLAANLERAEDGTPRTRSVEFISWNSLRKRFDFGLIENLHGDGPPRLRLVEEGKCVGCHKTRGPILGAGPWSNTTHNSLVRLATQRVLRPTADGRAARFDGIDVVTAHALEVDEHVRLGVARLRNREVFRLLTRSAEGRRLLTDLFTGLVTPVSASRMKAGRSLEHQSLLAVPLAEIDENLPGKIDSILTRVGFDREWLELLQAAPSSILLDFSPAGPPPRGFRGEWGGSPELIVQHDQVRSGTPAVLPGEHRPSSPRAFMKQSAPRTPPSSTVNTTRLAETIGLTEGDRHYMVRKLLEATANLRDVRDLADVANQINNGEATPATLTAAVLGGPRFADVFRDGEIPDRDEFKDRFLNGLKEVLGERYNRGGAIALDRAEYASSPAFTPRASRSEPPATPSNACLRCHDVWSPEKASLTDPVPMLAFDPFDRAARESWVRTAQPGRRLKVLDRMLKRLAEDQDMPPVDSPEHERFRVNDASGFDAVLEFLKLELDRAKGN